MLKGKNLLTPLLVSVVLLAGGRVQASDEVKVGILGAITGPIANLAPPIVDATQMAIDEVNAQGGILGGKTLVGVLGDSGCSPQAAVDSANKLINVTQVTAIIGAMCSGAHMATVNSVAVPAGIVMLSATATAPEVTHLKDNDLSFRVVPSDSFQGAASARNLLSQGVKRVAVTYVNNDYGKGLAEAFGSVFEAGGGTVTSSLAHEDKKPSYRSELATMAKGGADTLVIFAYGGGSGMTIIRQSLENGYFEKFVGGDGMKDDVLLKEIGAENLADLILTISTALPGNPSREIFNQAFTARGGKVDGAFVGQGYDAGFLMALAIEQAGGTDRGKIARALREVASAPGEVVLPGEWKRAVALIAAGKDIDYKGVAGDHEFDENGDVAGIIAEYLVRDGAYVQSRLLK